MSETFQPYFAPADYNARCDVLAGHLIALTGCDPVVARLAAGRFHTFRNAPDHGMGDPPRDPILSLKMLTARVVLNQWKVTLPAWEASVAA